MDTKEFSDIAKADSSVGEDNEGIVYEDAATGGWSRGSSQKSDPPPYEEKDKAVVKNSEYDLLEIKMREVLQKIARDCSNPNPQHRPTAKEVLRMLEAVAPASVLEEMQQNSMDVEDNDDDDDVITKKTN